MISGYLDIVQDYLDSPSEITNHLSNNPSMEEFQYGYLSDGDNSTYIEPTQDYGGYSFTYRKPNIYPDQVDFYFNSAADTQFKLLINDVLVGEGTGVGSSGSVMRNKFSFDLTKSQQKEINGIDISRSLYSPIKNKGEVQLANGDRLTDFDLAFFSSLNQTINNAETPLNPANYSYPSGVEPLSLSMGQTSGTLSDMPEILGVPTSGSNVDDNYVIFSGNYHQGSTDDFFRVNFNPIGPDDLVSVDKLVLRVRANNPLYSGNYLPFLRAEGYNQDLSETIPIVRGESSSIVGSGGFANYDIDFRFINPQSNDNNGFNYYRTQDSIKRLDASYFDITGMTSGTEISALELITYPKTDSTFSMFIPSEGSGSASMNMYLEQDNSVSSPFDMVVYNQNSGVDNSINMYMEVPQSGVNESLNMFLARDAEGLHHSFSMYINGTSSDNSQFDMYLQNINSTNAESYYESLKGVLAFYDYELSETDDSVDFYVRGTNDSGNNFLDLYTNGF